MTEQLVAAALCALLLGCAVDHRSPAPQKQTIVADAPDPSPETYALGWAVTVDGAVPKDAAADAFARGREVFLSVDASGAMTDQTIEVQWLDAAGRVVRKEMRHVPIGAAYVAFASGRDATANAGAGRAIVVINGRRVSEKTFRVL